MNHIAQAADTALALFRDARDRQLNAGGDGEGDRLDGEVDRVALVLAQAIGGRSAGEGALIVGSAMAKLGIVAGRRGPLLHDDIRCFGLVLAGAFIETGEFDIASEQVLACFKDQRKRRAP